jgi:cytochrome c peroxidase
VQPILRDATKAGCPSTTTRVSTISDHYAAGGRTISEGTYRGVGHDNPNKSPIVKGFGLTAEQKADLVAFLKALTDNDLLKDPRFTNPWTADHEEAR